MSRAGLKRAAAVSSAAASRIAAEHGVGFANLITTIGSARTVNRAVRAVRDSYPGVSHVTYVAARYGSEPDKDPYVRTTYPASWLVRYLFMGYWRVDPVLKAGFSRVAPFDWRDIDRGDANVAAFFADAQDHGIGRLGVLVPLTSRRNQRGILSISTDLPVELWDELKRAALPEFLEIGVALHRRGLAEVFGVPDSGPKLSPREVEMLRWISRGKDVPDIAIITSLSEHTVRTYLKSARIKLKAGTMAQAIVAAERLALLAGDDASA